MLGKETHSEILEINDSSEQSQKLNILLYYIGFSHLKWKSTKPSHHCFVFPAAILNIVNE